MNIRIERPEHLAVVAQLGQPRVERRHAALLCHLVDPHLAEQPQGDALPIRHAVKRLDDRRRRPAKLDDLITGHRDGVGHIEGEVPIRNERRGAVLANEGMANAERMRHVFDLGPCAAGTQHERDRRCKRMELAQVACQLIGWRHRQNAVDVREQNQNYGMGSHRESYSVADRQAPANT